ncbi:hypothetical protein [Staphylococcus pseudintermedius]|uniref:hypothetical protein n=1 Tax=Staphylococcus pseudintermedius TaxID=283734 RepID=UPI000C1C1D43|nr:hypothetical protein [Staphylococcus pseudintermedius]
MYKQFFKKIDGEPFLFNIKEIDSETINDEFTDIMPQEGLYHPIHFNGETWIGTSREEWLKNQVNEENEYIPDEKDKALADLTVQLLSTQEEVASLHEEIANLTLELLRG